MGLGSFLFIMDSSAFFFKSLKIFVSVICLVEWGNSDVIEFFKAFTGV